MSAHKSTNRTGRRCVALVHLHAERQTLVQAWLVPHSPERLTANAYRPLTMIGFFHRSRKTLSTSQAEKLPQAA